MLKIKLMETQAANSHAVLFLCSLDAGQLPAEAGHLFEDRSTAQHGRLSKAPAAFWKQQRDSRK